MVLVVWLAWCACVASGSASFRMIVPGETPGVEDKAAAESHESKS